MPTLFSPQLRSTSDELAKSGALFGYETLTGQITRSGYLLLAVSNGIGAFLQNAGPGMQVARGVVAVLAVIGYFWVRRRVPSYRARVISGIALTIWIIGSITLETRNGWPPRLELVPPACVYLALVVDWRLALALFLGMIAAIAGAFGSGFAPLPPFLEVTAGNWVIVGSVLLFVVHLQLRAFASGIRDLVASSRSLETARAQAAEITDELAHGVTERVAALSASLAVGPEAAATAARALAVTLEQSRRRVPPEATLSFGKLRGRVVRLRRELLRAFTVLGTVLLPLQALRLWVAGVSTMTVLVMVLFTVLLGIALFVQRRPHYWRQASLVTAVVLCLGYVGTYRYWIAVPGSPIIPPSVSLNLLTIIMLGVVTGNLRLMIVPGGVMALIALLLAGSRGIMSVMACVIYIAAGVMLTNLPQDLLTAIQVHRREALDAIRRRRRIVGTLFHDLANPLQIVSLLLEDTRATGGRAIPEEIPGVVHRMRATIDAALGRIQPPEPIQVRELIEALVAVFRWQLDAKGLRLLCVGDVDAVIVGNRTLLQDTVLANLFSNAIKFSPAGAEITLHVYRGNGEVRLEVRDRGPGLPDTVRDAVEAGRVAPSHTGSAGESGSGYGLLLATDYLRDMGGALAFEPRADGGLTARITLAAA
jgi:signal transduction histidine kinase